MRNGYAYQLSICLCERLVILPFLWRNPAIGKHNNYLNNIGTLEHFQKKFNNKIRTVSWGTVLSPSQTKEVIVLKLFSEIFYKLWKNIFYENTWFHLKFSMKCGPSRTTFPHLPTKRWLLLLNRSYQLKLSAFLLAVYSLMFGVFTLPLRWKAASSDITKLAKNRGFLQFSKTHSQKRSHRSKSPSRSCSRTLIR